MKIEQKDIDRFMKYVNKTDSCWLWIGSNDGKRGYGKFSYIGKRFNSHRFSYMVHKGEIPKGMCVCHSCDVPSCINPEHLFIGTYKQNSQDMVDKGRQNSVKGTKQGLSKLTEEQVLEIRKKYIYCKNRILSSGYSIPKLSKEYNVSIDTIWNIIHKKTWKHI